jgi:hypothetical protein
MLSYGNITESEMTVAELIEELKKLPQDAIVLQYGGDEFYHIAEGVELQKTNRDIDWDGKVTGPFVTLF